MKKFLPLIIIGLFIKLLIIPVTLHPDFRAVNLAGYLIAQKGEIFSFYDYISRLPRTDSLVQLYGDNLFIYPPLAYLSHAVFNKLFYWAYPQSAFWTLINDIGQLRQAAGFFPLMYWLKLPYLIADIFCFWLLLRYIPNTKYQILTWLWWFNPVVWYVNYMIGQFDIFIALFILLAYIFASNKKPLSALFLGLGAGFKPFPLILLLLLPGSKIKNLIVGLGTYLLIITPFLGSPAFKQYALLASQSDKMLFAKIPISGSQYLPVFLLGLLLLYWWNYYHPKSLPLWGWLASPLLLFYSVTHFHPQWFIWVIPLMVVAVISNIKLLVPYIALIASYFAIVLFFEPSLNFGLFGLSFWLPQLTGHYLNSEFLSSVFRGLLAGTAFAFILTPWSQNDQSQ